MSTKIVIASTLKPISDPRAYEKIGKSIAAAGHYEVIIMGRDDGTLSNIPKLKLVPHHSNLNTFFSRLLLPFKLYFRIQKLNPQVLILTTHELLFMGVLLKVFTKVKLIYDIQENYNFNLRYQKIYPWGLRHFLAGYIRFKEQLASQFIDLFFFAEKCYTDELIFLQKRNYVVLENKFLSAHNGGIQAVHQSKIEFLLSGTISELYGAYDALNFIKHFPDDQYGLRIVGHCRDVVLREHISRVAAESNNVTINISSAPIPHNKILASIGEKTVGLLPYRDNKSTRNKLPTKLYEYIGLGIPILISPNKSWNKLIEDYHAGVSIDFKKPPQITHISKFITLSKVRKPLDLKNIMWKNEETKLLVSLNEIITN